MQLSRILVPIDIATAPGQSIAYAMDLAHACSSTLVLLVFDTASPHDTAQETVFSKLPASTQTYVEEHLTFADGIEVEYHVTADDDQGDSILHCSQHANIDLIVIESEVRKKLGWTFLDGVSQEVLRASHCPVLSLRGEYSLSPKRILSPVDFSEANQRAVEQAGLLAGLTGANMNLLHVVEDIRVPGLYIEFDNPAMELSSQVQEKVEKGMESFKTSIPDEVSVNTSVLQGNAASEIIDFAANHAIDLIVIASHGLSGIERFFLGSVADRILNLAQQPVLLIPSIKPSLDDDL